VRHNAQRFTNGQTGRHYDDYDAKRRRVQYDRLKNDRRTNATQIFSNIAS